MFPESWEEQIFPTSEKPWSKFKLTVSVVNICFPLANSQILSGPAWGLCAMKRYHQLPANLKLPSVKIPDHTSIPGSTHSDPWREARANLRVVGRGWESFPPDYFLLRIILLTAGATMTRAKRRESKQKPITQKEADLCHLSTPQQYMGNMLRTDQQDWWNYSFAFS